ncbi:MAG: TraR/DksA C4-type zinc finger protein [Desulfovibrio sp.]
MADVCDMAQASEALELCAALSRVATDNGPGPVMIGGVACCIDCELPIDPARLAALPGCSRCVRCQEEIDT